MMIGVQESKRSTESLLMGTGLPGSLFTKNLVTGVRDFLSDLDEDARCGALRSLNFSSSSPLDSGLRDDLLREVEGILVEVLAADG